MPGSQNTFTPDHSDLIRMLIDKVLLDMYFGMPAKVVSYDSSTQFADVEIQLYQGFMDGSKKPYPVIPNVPVKHPRANGGAARIHMPIQPGDDVILMFTSRSIDSWKTNGGMTDPGDARKHHLSDCFALIGGSAKADAFDVEDPTAIEVVNEDSKLQVFPDGTFAIKNGTAELIEQVQLLAKTLSTDTTNTIFGPMQLNGFETYTEIAQNVETLVNGG